MFKNIFHIFCLLLLTVIFSSCAHNFTSPAGEKLDTASLNESHNTEPINLAAEGKCPGTLPLNVINKESRTERYIIYDSMGRKFYIIPNEFTDYVVDYMEAKLRESNLTVDDAKGKEIHVSIEELSEKDAAAGFSLWAWVKLKITIPEIGYSQVYSGDDGSFNGYNAVAYAVHHAVQKFLEDETVQEYIQCRKADIEVPR